MLGNETSIAAFLMMIESQREAAREPFAGLHELHYQLMITLISMQKQPPLLLIHNNVNAIRRRARERALSISIEAKGRRYEAFEMNALYLPTKSKYMKVHLLALPGRAKH